MFSCLLASLRVFPVIAALTAGAVVLVLPATARAETVPGTAIRVGTWIPGQLTGPADRDRFRFRLARTTTVLIIAGDLPSDHRLTLLDDAGRRRGFSDRPGTTFEELQVRLPAGRYVAEVSSGSTAAPGPYRLIVRTLPERPVVLDAHPDTAGGLYAVSGQLLNNTGAWRRHPRVTVRFYAADGSYLGESTGLTAQTYLGPRQRGHFRIVAARPAGTTRYTLAIRTERTAPPRDPALTVRPDVPYPVAGARLRYVGRVAGTAGKVHVHVARYNRIGAFVDAGHVVLHRLLPGEPGRYEFELPAYPYVRGEQVTYAS